MRVLTRRRWLGALSAAGLGCRDAFAAREKLRIGVTDWNLELGADPQAVILASQLGF